ncbi:hydrolase [Streptomyces termitum]|uniref:Hydrolase n=1 Tax=Streptomyces termitum TaxID=67368 RepID=A0A918T9R8_9ACTN|nr:hydrolase [Streptomyces termitum]
MEAQLPDVEAGKRFYGELFGWTFAADRAEALLRGRRAAGLLPKRDGRMPTTWTVYLATRDAAAVAGRVRAAGGHMVMEPYPAGPAEVLALAADPGGAVLGLRQTARDDGFQVVNEPGSFCWMEVYTRSPGPVDTFYASVLGWLGHQADPAAEGKAPGFDYRVWSPPGARPGDDSAFGGRAVITDAFPAEMPGHVLVYFAVRDCDATCATAVRLGGRIAEPPADTPYGRMAVLHDDQGARFAVLAEPEPAPAPEPEPAPAPEPEPPRATEERPPREPSREPEPQPSREPERSPGPGTGPGPEPGAKPGTRTERDPEPPPPEG